MLLSGGPLWAEDADQAQVCLETGQSCFGKVLDDCLAEQGDPAVIPPQCWQKEQAVWQIVQDRFYSRVLLETFSAPKPVTIAIRAEQDAWMQYKTLRCTVQASAEPRTHGVMEHACNAQMTYDRAVDLSFRIGADWTAE